MASKYIQKFPIPYDFPDILTEFTTEILRNQPLDIIDFGIEYFRCLEEQKILDYPNRGPNIPCDFKPCIPTIPKKLQKDPMSLEAYKEYQQTLKEDLERREKMKQETTDFEKAFEERLRELKLKELEEKKDEDDGMMIGGGEIIEPSDEIEIMAGGGVMINVEEEEEEEEERQREKEREEEEERQRQKEKEEEEERQRQKEKEEEEKRKKEKEKQIKKEKVEEKVNMIGGGEIIEPDDTKDIMVGGGEIIIPDVERDIMEGGGIIIEPDDTKDIMEGGGIMEGEIDEEDEGEVVQMEGGGVMIGEEEDEVVQMEGGGVMIGEEEDEGEVVQMEGGGVMIGDEEDEGEVVQMEGGGVMIGDEEDENEVVQMEGGGVMIGDEEDENEVVQMEGGGVMIGDEEDEVVQMEGGGVMIGDEEDDYGENVQMTGGGEINDNDDNDINELPDGKYLSTRNNFNEIKESLPMGISSEFSKNKHYEDCIDFNEKESQLEKLKELDKEEIETYINTVFTPNKGINDTLVNMQDALNSLYKNKGTEKENEFNALNEEIKNKLSEAKLQILENDPKTQALNDAVADFRSYDYYDRVAKCYSIKLNDPFDDDDAYLNEFCYYLFNHRLSNIDNSKLKKYPYIKQYFNHNIELLQPDIYGFVKNCQNYSEDEFNDKFTNFPIKKRELCRNFYKLINLDKDSPEVKRCLNQMDKCRNDSSLKQIYSHLTSCNESNQNEVLDLVKEKLDKNHIKISNFIDNVSSGTDDELNNQFKSFKAIERNIIVEYLKLKNSNEVADKLNELEIDEDDSSFCHKMKDLYKDSENAPELNDRNKCICNNKLFDASDKLKEHLKKYDNKDSLNEDEIINEFNEFSPNTQEGIYYYSSILNKNDGRLDSLINKMKNGNQKIGNEENPYVGGYIEDEEDENKVKEKKRKKRGPDEEGLESDTDKELGAGDQGEMYLDDEEKE